MTNSVGQQRLSGVGTNLNDSFESAEEETTVWRGCCRMDLVPGSLQLGRKTFFFCCRGWRRAAFVLAELRFCHMGSSLWRLLCSTRSNLDSGVRNWIWKGHKTTNKHLGETMINLGTNNHSLDWFDGGSYPVFYSSSSHLHKEPAANHKPLSCSALVTTGC